MNISGQCSQFCEFQGKISLRSKKIIVIQSNPVNVKTKVAIKSVHINRVSVLSGLN